MIKNKILLGVIATGLCLSACSMDDIKNPGEVSQGVVEDKIKDTINATTDMVSEEVKCDWDGSLSEGGSLTCKSRHYKDWTPVTATLEKGGSGKNMSFDIKVGGKSIINDKALQSN